MEKIFRDLESDSERKNKNKTVTFVVTLEQSEAMDLMARRTCRTRSHLVRYGLSLVAAECRMVWPAG